MRQLQPIGLLSGARKGQSCPSCWSQLLSQFFRLIAFLAARPGPYELHVQYMSCEGQDEREIAGPAWQLVVPVLRYENRRKFDHQIFCDLRSGSIFFFV